MIEKRYTWRQWNWGGVVLPLIRIQKYEVFLLGMGDDIDSILLYLKANGIVPKGFLCFDKKPMKSYAGIPFVEVKDLAAIDVTRAYVLITDPNVLRICRRRQVLSRYKKWRERNSCVSKLERYGLQRYYCLRQSEIADIYVFPNHNLYNGRMHYYKTHLEELKQTYDMLQDKVSKETLVEYIRAYLQSGWYKLPECDGRNKYFAGSGRDNDTERLYMHSEDEVWVNCGASVGDSILLYLADGYKAKKIYAFEGSKATYEILQKNINQLPSELKAGIVPVNEFISENTKWNEMIREKITLINADIEGAEMSLLCAIKDRIKSDRPVLAICVYHRNDDLVRIPQYINAIADRYRFVLRKYACTVGNAMRTSELVFYAIPEERYLLMS